MRKIQILEVPYITGVGFRGGKGGFIPDAFVMFGRDSLGRG